MAMNITATAMAARLASEPRCLTAVKLQNADCCAGTLCLDVQPTNSICGYASDIRYHSLADRRSSHAKSSNTAVGFRSIRVLRCSSYAADRAGLLKKRDH